MTNKSIDDLLCPYHRRCHTDQIVFEKKCMNNYKSCTLYIEQYNQEVQERMYFEIGGKKHGK